MSLVIFDVDQTLLRGYSGFYTTLDLIRAGILKKRRLLVAFFYLLISPFYKGNVQRMYEMAARDMAGSNFHDILEIGRKCFLKSIRPRLYREGIEEIEKHKKRGDPVYLLTSGPAMTILILAEFLGVDGSQSSGPEMDREGRLTPKVRMPICYREGKVSAAENLIRRHGVRWEDCYYYADSIDDCFLLEKVGHPVLVNPDSKIAKIGRQKGWPVLHFSHQLGNFT